MTFLWHLATTMPKRKRCKRKRLIPMPDRLGALPEEILCHILSFLSTKQAAATSILSKRWNSLWLSVLTLDLVVKNNYQSDIDTFQRVILLRDINLPIQTLRLKSHVRTKRNLINEYPPVPVRRAEYPPGQRIGLLKCRRVGRIRSYNLDPLIMVAIERGLETLEIGWIGARLVSNIFSCKTLTFLKLWDVVIEMKDFTGINISPLKILHLDQVHFSCPTDIINFLLFFPTLEELQTCGAYYFTPQTDQINKCLPNLMRATVSESKTIPFFLLSKAFVLNIKLTSTHMMQIEHIWSQVPTFHNLTQMELLFEYDSKDYWEWMLEMLQQCPKLQHLIINEQHKSGDDEDNWHEPDVVPECLSSQLRTCLIINYTGRKCDLQLAEYVMQNSKVLRSLTIHSSCSLDLKAKSHVLQKLSLCPRSCDLIFD